MVAAAVVGSAVVGGVVASRGASKAADAQKDAAKSASATELYQFEQNREDMQPFRDAGQSAVDQLRNQLGLITGPTQVETDANIRDRLRSQVAGRGYSANEATQRLNALVVAEREKQARAIRTTQSQQRGQAGFGALNEQFEFEQDPGYQFRMDEGMRGVEASAAARGGALGGRALKELARYGQGFASNEYGNAYNRFNNDQTQRFNRLSSLAGTGQTAATQIGQMGGQVASNVAGNQLAAGNARASGYVGQANAISGGINTLGSLYGMGAFGNNGAGTVTGGSGMQAGGGGGLQPSGSGWWSSGTTLG